MSEYSGLSREQLEHRLRRAEDVCLMFGWAGWQRLSERGDATMALWRAWADHPGVSLADRADLLAAETDGDYALRHLRDDWLAVAAAARGVLDQPDEPRRADTTSAATVLNSTRLTAGRAADLASAAIAAQTGAAAAGG